MTRQIANLGDPEFDYDAVNLHTMIEYVRNAIKYGPDYPPPGSPEPKKKQATRPAKQR